MTSLVAPLLVLAVHPVTPVRLRITSLAVGRTMSGPDLGCSRGSLPSPSPSSVRSGFPSSIEPHFFGGIGGALSVDRGYLVVLSLSYFPPPPPLLCRETSGFSSRQIQGLFCRGRPI
ncbi:hypothetical protein AB6A40_007338 [Gnathostoma spinigerum]|uniref:Secreted protein n=1 Tax=Gnathostoma spinigerum TaxID=75299 RepID=A0ABD6ETK8_9BILA